MISFDDTETAFKSKTDAELNRAYKLFKLVGSNTLVSFGKWATNVALLLKLPIKGPVKATIFKQFCGGETIAECDPTIHNLWRFGIGTILDYSVEGKESEADFERTCSEILRTVQRSDQEESIPFSVFKVTGITTFSLLEKLSSNQPLSAEEEKKYDQFYNRIDRICAAAFNANTPVFIDAEESWIQEAIDTVCATMMEKYNKKSAIVYNTIQLYRWDRLAYIKKLHNQSRQESYFLGLKLVRGAYMEKERERAKEQNYPSPIQKDKQAADQDYDDALKYCIENINTIAFCAGTHNERSTLYLTELMKQNGVEKNNAHIYFAQLLGMSDHISYNLSNAGYNVAKYVPYGPVNDVLPYLLRRADENTSVAGQTSRELALIMKERKRRSAR
ncbi:MAG: proline dehydrogenase [Crocinitomicaceae bacterium]|nr:proline dehydrogenase [Crocinitomicaceae bacterium]